MKQFDYTKWLNKNWDVEIIEYIAKIHEFKGRQELYLNKKPAVLQNLVELAIIQSTTSSNEIEGIITTNQRIKELVMKKVAPKNRDEEEIMGYQDVLQNIHESYEYILVQSSYILQLHRDLYKYSEKSIGGKFKNAQNYIQEKLKDGTSVIRFIPLEPFETPKAVDDICINFNQMITKEALNPLILIPIFIHDFLCIHPFNDGNGRMSRLLTTLLLYKSGYVVGKYISLEKKIENSKQSYYDALEQSGIGWHENKEDPTPFVKYMLSIILAAYKDFEDRVDLFSEKLPALEQVRKAANFKVGKFTKRDIMELCSNLSRASVENSLTELVREGYLERHGKGRSTYYVLKYKI